MKKEIKAKWHQIFSHLQTSKLIYLINKNKTIINSRHFYKTNSLATDSINSKEKIENKPDIISHNNYYNQSSIINSKLNIK